MTQLAFPQILGVTFYAIPKFPRYAVSSDGHVWSSRGRKWAKMRPFRHVDGPSVKLQFAGGVGCTVQPVKSLLAAILPPG